MAARGIGSVYCGLAASLLLTLAAIRYDKAIIVIGLAFLAVYWRAAAATFRRHRALILTTAALLAWIAVLTWLRDDRISRLLLIQYASFATGFVAALVALDHVDDPAPAIRIVLLFLLLQVIWVFMPDSVLYSGFLRVFLPFGGHLGRWSSIFNNPNNYGIAMALAFALAVSLWLDRVIGTRLLLTAAAIAGGQIYLSGSRNAVVTVVAVALLAAFASRQRPMPLRRAAAVATGVILLLAALVTATILASDHYWGRSVAIPLGIRQIAWTTFPRLALEHPLIGTSAGQFLTGELVAHGHNLLLTLAVEWSFIGLALCLLWAAQFAKAATWSWARVILVTPLLLGQVIDDFHYFRPFGVAAAIVAAWCIAVSPDRLARGPDVRAAA
jgi:O-antigen ligase